jgi:hypothetical protein
MFITHSDTKSIVVVQAFTLVLDFLLDSKTIAWLQTVGNDKKMEYFPLHIVLMLDKVLSKIADAALGFNNIDAAERKAIASYDMTGFNDTFADLEERIKYLKRCRSDNICFDRFSEDINQIARLMSTRGNTDATMLASGASEGTTKTSGNNQGGGDNTNPSGGGGGKPEGDEAGGGSNKPPPKKKARRSGGGSMGSSSGGPDPKTKGCIIFLAGSGGVKAFPAALMEKYCGFFFSMGKSCNRGTKCAFTHTWFDQLLKEEQVALIKHVEENKQYIRFNKNSPGVMRALPSKYSHLLGSAKDTTSG